MYTIKFKYPLTAEQSAELKPGNIFIGDPERGDMNCSHYWMCMGSDLDSADFERIFPVGWFGVGYIGGNGFTKEVLDAREKEVR